MAEAPQQCVCQFCQHQVVTGTRYVNGTMTYVSAGVVCFFGGVIGCCLIPFCLDACKDVEHVCPNCQKIVGIYRRM